MSKIEWPEMITALPEIDLDTPGVLGRLMQAGDKQLVFFSIDPVGVVPLHSHGAQWGIVVDGELDLTIGEETRTYVKGESYFIPAGVQHGATFKKPVKVIDIFDEAARYKPKA